MMSLEEISQKYGPNTVVTGEAAFKSEGYIKNYIGNDLVIACDPWSKLRAKTTPEFRIIRIKYARFTEKGTNNKILDMCVVFAYLIKKNYPEDLLLEFYWDLINHNKTNEEIFRYSNPNRFRKYPILRKLKRNYKSFMELFIHASMFNSHLPDMRVNSRLKLDKYERDHYAHQTGYRAFSPDFYWPRERVVAEYDGEIHGQQSNYMNDGNKNNFYNHRKIDVIHIHKHNWRDMIDDLHALIFKRRGYKSRENYY
jgi:very-short-patch-repair endonuclease